MRTDDYRFYGQQCLRFGIILLIIGVAVPLFVTIIYLNVFIALAVFGVILIVVSRILVREYNLRVAEAKKTTPPIPPSPPKANISPNQTVPTARFCRYCGKELTPDLNYCPFCGQKTQ